MIRKCFNVLMLASVSLPLVSCNSFTGFAYIGVGATPGQAIPSNFMGLSHEWGTAQSMMGDSVVGVDQIYRQLLQNLTAYGSDPIVLRIGGGSTDHTHEPTPATVRPVAELATALGTPFYLGVNLGSDDVNLAVDQARAYVSRMPAGSLSAIEIGNEPDLYVSDGYRPAPYTYASYQADFDTWKTNIMPLLPSGTKLMGPSWAWPSELSNINPFLSAEAPALTAVSQHYYVGSALAQNPSDMLLKPSAANSGASAVSDAVAMTHQYGIPFRIGETNSLSVGGETGISDVFQSALWAIDAMFNYINVGVDGVNWHCGSSSVYDAFRISVKTSGAQNAYVLTSVRPLYYGLLLFQAATGNEARLLPLTLKTHSDLSAWATVDASGKRCLVIINKDEVSTGAADVAIPGYTHANIYRLTAPSYQATSGVTFAGQTFDGSTDGTIQGKQVVETVDAVNSVFEIPMPVTSAALIVFTK